MYLGWSTSASKKRGNKMGFDPVTMALMASSTALGYKGEYDARKEQRRQSDLQAAGYNFSAPYIERSYDRAEAALNDSLEQGTYQGQTYADMNPFLNEGLRFGGQAGAQIGMSGAEMADTARGFAGNYNDLYSRANQDRIGSAMDYATANSSPLIQAAMRNDFRNLSETTIPGINVSASGGANMNSSRAGVAEAVANRAFDDRMADTSASINDSLMSRYLSDDQQQFNNAMNANRALGGVYNTGLQNISQGANMMSAAGRGYMDYDQGALTDAYRRFNEARDFPLQQNIAYQKGILNNAVYESPRNPSAVTASPLSGAIGGAMQGFGYSPAPGNPPPF